MESLMIFQVGIVWESRRNVQHLIENSVSKANMIVKHTKTQ